MNKIFLIALLALTIGACKNSGNQLENQQNKEAEVTQDYVSFGAEISNDEALDASAMMALYADLKEGDTLAAKFQAPVNSVCKMKGCWMRLAVGDQEAFVKFKDYGFFVPKYLSEVEVIVSGKAYVSMTSVEDLKHFAQDAGKIQEEIDAITEPELSFDFMADGVLVPASAIVEESEQEPAEQATDSTRDTAASTEAAE